MVDKNSALLARLLATFRIEAEEYVRSMSNGLLRLEKLPADEPMQREIIETIFRHAHSLKGAARAVNFTQIEAICQPLESIFSALRDRELALSTSLADLLHNAVSLIEGLARGNMDQAREKQPEISAVVRQLDRLLTRGDQGDTATVRRVASLENGQLEPDRSTSEKEIGSNSRKSADPTGTTNQSAMPSPDHSRVADATLARTTKTVRVATEKLDAVMRLSEEMLAARLAAAQRSADIRGALNELIVWRKRAKHMQSFLRPLERTPLAAHAADELGKLISYFEDQQLYVHGLEDKLSTICRSADKDCRALASMTDDLQQRVKDLQLLPCNTLLDLFARQARTLAREQGKEVELTVQGSDIEVDRRLLDEIKDPLIHLVRNCIDHGIEKPAQRRESKKAPEGRISISVMQKDSGKIAIIVTDDGTGIDTQRLKAVAVERGVLTPEEADSMSEAKAIELVFRSGLSTSRMISDLSGRGLGMAIVRDKIESLGGSIDISSTTNVGTRYDLVLPISLATFRGTLIEVAEKTFVIPSANVDRVLRVPLANIHHTNNSDTVDIAGQALALVWLHDILQLPRRPAEIDNTALTIVLGRGLSRVAFRVDTVIGEQEVLVKGLGPQLRRVPNVAGASILGSGQVALVLNVPDLLDAASRQPSAVSALATPDTPPDRVQQSILVAEDSITSRSLMKNILEAAGFRVVTTVDGIDAYTTLKTQPFDLLVSDVDMPRMNGFDLTAKIRADGDLAEIPVILITTLDSREDRERGVDSGANAYIVKSSFDQSSLLDVIQRLI